jgi:hypothetical protein
LRQQRRFNQRIGRKFFSHNKINVQTA